MISRSMAPHSWIALTSGLGLCVTRLISLICFTFLQYQGLILARTQVMPGSGKPKITWKPQGSSSGCPFIIFHHLKLTSWRGLRRKWEKETRILQVPWHSRESSGFYNVFDAWPKWAPISCIPIKQSNKFNLFFTLIGSHIFPWPLKVWNLHKFTWVHLIEWCLRKFFENFLASPVADRVQSGSPEVPPPLHDWHPSHPNLQKMWSEQKSSRPKVSIQH